MSVKTISIFWSITTNFKVYVMFRITLIIIIRSFIQGDGRRIFLGVIVDLIWNEMNMAHTKFTSF